MKISFFCIKFPIASETFVLNQVISFMKMGYDVNIISIFPGDMEKIHEDFETYKVASKTTYIFKTDNRDKKVFTLFQRFFLAFKCLAKGNIDAFNIKKFSLFSKNLLLPSLAGTIKKKLKLIFL